MSIEVADRVCINCPHDEGDHRAMFHPVTGLEADRRCDKCVCRWFATSETPVGHCNCVAVPRCVSPNGEGEECGHGITVHSSVAVAQRCLMKDCGCEHFTMMGLLHSSHHRANCIRFVPYEKVNDADVVIAELAMESAGRVFDAMKEPIANTTAMADRINETLNKPLFSEPSKFKADMEHVRSRGTCGTANLKEGSSAQDAVQEIKTPRASAPLQVVVVENLRKLAEQATPGKWIPQHDRFAEDEDPAEHIAVAFRGAIEERRCCFVAVEGTTKYIAFLGWGPNTPANTAYLAAVDPATILALLDALDGCRAHVGAQAGALRIRDDELKEAKARIEKMERLLDDKEDK